MNKCILGIDLGTSSVKVLARYFDGTVKKASAAYTAEVPASSAGAHLDSTDSGSLSVKSWLDALVSALRKLDCSAVCAIGLSSQVGTYIINDQDIIGWRDAAGAQELRRLKEKYSCQDFIANIAMPHPDISSYPLPRLLYIKEHYPQLCGICQPKDLIIRFLTGNLVTDPYSWRGLADPDTGEYSSFFLKELGIDKAILPPMKRPEQIAGYVSEAAAACTGLHQGIPVYTGMNDFYASLAGMGIGADGTLFDITGTSEHIGMILHSLQEETRMVSGKYLGRGSCMQVESTSDTQNTSNAESTLDTDTPPPSGGFTSDYVHYGVTASSGASLGFGLKEFGGVTTAHAEMLAKSPPIFTPYLSGERAPIFDADATGMFFGISTGCSREALAYAVLEGVAFSLYHIYENLNAEAATRIIVSGGASVNDFLNQLKANLFGKEVITLKENDTSALGAVMTAAIGMRLYKDYREAASAFCEEDRHYQPDPALQPALMKRYHIYKQLYPLLKEQMKEYRRL